MDTPENSAEEHPEEKERKTCGAWFKVRYLIIVHIFQCLFLIAGTRAVIPVTIIVMLNTTSDSDEWGLGWHNVQGEWFVVTAYYWGFTAAQIPGGLLVQLVGYRWPLLVGMVASSTFAILIPPVSIYRGWIATCAVRVFQGIAQGIVYPSVFVVLAMWSPLEERGRLLNLALCGNQIGTAVSLAVAGTLISTPWGWPSVFYVLGGLGFLWSVSWYFFGDNSPAAHRLISKEERLFIESSVASKFSVKMKTPWKKIFSSLSVWSIVICHCAHNVGYLTLLTLIPTYMDSILNFRIQANGLLSALPYLTMAILCFIFGWLSDFSFKKHFFSVTISRKIFNTIGFWIPAVALFSLGFVKKEHRTIAVSLLIVAVGFSAGNYAGFGMSHMDIAPNFSGILLGLTTFSANVVSILGMTLAEFFVTNDKTDVENWQVDFFVTAVVMFFANLIYIFLYKAERASWNEQDFHREIKT